MPGFGLRWMTRRSSLTRVSDEVIALPGAIKPHPHGIEIGQLRRMLPAGTGTLESFLTGSFSRVGKKTAEEICRNAGLSRAGAAVTLPTKSRNG